MVNDGGVSAKGKKLSLVSAENLLDVAVNVERVSEFSDPYL